MCDVSFDALFSDLDYWFLDNSAVESHFVHFFFLQLWTWAVSRPHLPHGETSDRPAHLRVWESGSDW